MRDHSFTDNVPPCTATKYNYFVLQSLQINSVFALEDFLTRSLKAGQTNLLFKINFLHTGRDMEYFILEMAKKVYSNITYNSFQVEIRANKEQMVYELNFT